MERTLWYKDAVFYQIWPRSFKDGNGDGVGFAMVSGYVADPIAAAYALGA